MPKPDNVGAGIAVLIWNENGKLLLMKRKGAHAEGRWAVPGGWIEVDDDFNTAAKREVREEVGININITRLFTATTEYHPEIGIRSITIYMNTTVSSDCNPKIMEPNKCSELRWFSWDEILSMNESEMFPGLYSVVSQVAT